MTHLWSRLLEGSGHDVVFESSSPEGVERVRACAPDVLVCPGSPRFSTAPAIVASLRELVATRPLVIATSLEDAVGVGGWSLDVVDAVLRKPFDRATLLSLLDRVWEEHRARSRERPLAVVVEDGAGASRVLCQMLEALGFDVEAAFDANSGAALVDRTLPNFVLCSAELPEVSGWDLCARLAASERTRDVPVVVATGIFDEDLAARGLAKGAIDVLPKPVDERALAALARSRVRLGAWRPRGGGALVLEDERVVATLARRMLAELSVSAHVCPSAADLAGYLAVGTPGLFLFDMELPDGNGLDLCRELRARPEYDGIPVVLMSATSSLARRRECLMAGADDFLKKPFSRDEVRVRIVPLMAAAAEAKAR